MQVRASGHAAAARLVFRVAPPDEGTGVQPSVDPSCQRLREQFGLVEPAFAQTMRVERDGQDEIDGRGVELGAQRRLQQIAKVLRELEGATVLEGLHEFRRRERIAQGAAGPLEGRRICLAGFAYKIVVRRRGNGAAAADTFAASLQKGQVGEAAGTDVAPRPVRGPAARRDGAGTWPDPIGHAASRTAEQGDHLGKSVRG